MVDTSPASRYGVIPMEHCAAIGLVTITWADFELTVDRACWVLMGVDQQIGACVTSQSASMFNRMSALKCLVAECGGSDGVSRKLAKLGDRLGSLSEARNRVVHDARFLAMASQTVKRFQASARHRLKFDHCSEDVSALHEIVDNIAAAKIEFLAIWREIASELDSLPRAPRRPRKLVFPDLECAVADPA